MGTTGTELVAGAGLSRMEWLGMSRIHMIQNSRQSLGTVCDNKEKLTSANLNKAYLCLGMLSEASN